MERRRRWCRSAIAAATAAVVVATATRDIAEYLAVIGAAAAMIALLAAAGRWLSSKRARAPRRFWRAPLDARNRP